MPVKASITSTSERTVGIYYTIDNWKNENYVSGKTTITGEIKTAGKTTIYAYAVDKDGNESEIAKKDVLYDNIPPVIKETEITGSKRRKWMV